jgi:ribonuclease P/MRP protein subunit RPP1
MSLDISQRLPFPLRHNLFTNLISRSVAIELCYAAGIGDTAARRNIISNATGLVRATRGRGLLVSSEVKRTAEARGPFDVINWATFWGVKQEFGMGDGRRVVLHSEARRLTYRGAVQIMTNEIKELENVEAERPKRNVEQVDEPWERKPKEKRRRKKGTAR